MSDLRQQLQSLFQGRVCLVGLGNADLGDDGFGVRLAEALKKLFCSAPEHEPVASASEFREGPLNRRGAKDKEERWEPGHIPDHGSRTKVIVAGRIPENHIGRIMREDWTHVLFVDAVDFGAEPGATMLMDSSVIVTRLPQVSTHKLSVALLAKLVQSNGFTKAWLLGVQPESLASGKGLSPRVQATLKVLRDLLLKVRAGECRASGLERRSLGQNMPQQGAGGAL